MVRAMEGALALTAAAVDSRNWGLIYVAAALRVHAPISRCGRAKLASELQ